MEVGNWLSESLRPACGEKVAGKPDEGQCGRSGPDYLPSGGGTSDFALHSVSQTS
jgi:hypothetical protein